VVGMDAPSACATIMRKGGAKREPKTTKRNTTLSVIISRTRQTSSAINKAISQSQIISNLKSHSQ
jgi:hypothetical protein